MTEPVEEPNPPVEPPVTEQSVLKTIKKLLGLAPDYGAFDLDVLTHINTAIMTLEQLGASNGTYINSEQETWADILAPEVDLHAAKTFVYLSVRLIFDPPRNGFTVNSFRDAMKELEWRLMIQKET